MKTNWPNRGKFESWVSSHSAIDHPCALHHQACFWMALWPLPRTAGGFFEPLFWTFPGCILLYFLPGRSPSGCLPFWLFVTYKGFAGGANFPPTVFLEQTTLFRALQGGQFPPHRLFSFSFSFEWTTLLIWMFLFFIRALQGGHFTLPPHRLSEKTTLIRALQVGHVPPHHHIWDWNWFKLKMMTLWMSCVTLSLLWIDSSNLNVYLSDIWNIPRCFSPSAFNTGFSSYPATSCLSQGGSFLFTFPPACTIEL